MAEKKKPVRGQRLNRLGELRRDGEIVRLSLAGYGYERIALELKVSHNTVKAAIDRTRAEWRERRISDVEELTLRELARLDELALLARESFDRSREGLSPRGSKRYGDSRFIHELLLIIERRCAILGIDAPKQIEATGDFFSGAGPRATRELQDAGVGTLEEATAFLDRALATSRDREGGGRVN